MKKILSIAALLLCATPAIAHDPANWKIISWKENVAEGTCQSILVNTNSIIKARGIVSYEEHWGYSCDKKRVINEAASKEGSIRVHHCEMNEYLVGTTYRDPKLKVKPLSRWQPVPAGQFFDVHKFVCR